MGVSFCDGINTEPSCANGITILDLHPSNVLFQFSFDFDQLSLDQLHEKYRSPNPEPVVRLNGQALGPNVPSQARPPIWLGKPSKEISPAETRILLTNFGEAYSPSSEHRNYSNAPLCYYTPEARFEPERGLSTPSDVWSLACFTWAILGTRDLFES